MNSVNLMGHRYKAVNIFLLQIPLPSTILCRISTSIPWCYLGTNSIAFLSISVIKYQFIFSLNLSLPFSAARLLAQRSWDWKGISSDLGTFPYPPFSEALFLYIEDRELRWEKQPVE